MVSRGMAPEQIQKEAEAEKKRKDKEAKEAAAEAAAAAAEAEAKALGIPGDSDGDKKPDIGVSTDPLTGRTFLKDSGENPVWLIPDPRNPNSYTYSSNFDLARKSVQEQYVKRDGDLEGLRKELYSKGYITQSAYRAKDNAALNKAIYDSLTQYGIDQIDAMTMGKQPNPMSFQDYVSRLTGSISGGPETTTGKKITTRGDADEEVNTFFYNYFGRRATKKEREDYFTELNKAERSALIKRTSSDAGSVETGSLIDGNDKFFIFGKIAAPAAKGTDIEVLLKGGGQIAQDILELKDYANQNGYRITDDEARMMVNQVLTKRGTDLNTFKTKIRGVSRSMYSNLQLEDGVDVNDIAKQFSKIKEETLELAPGSINIFDKDVQEALRNNGNKGAMDMTSYMVKLRNDPRWPKTQNAIEEAASYATTILKSFGLI